VRARAPRRAAAGAALIAISALGCLPGAARRWNPFGGLLPPDAQDERDIGAEFDAALRERVVLIDDPQVAGFVNELGQQLVATLEPQPYAYRFRVVRDPSLNAFAVPGGYVYVHTGTLLAAGSTDELVGVLAHEVGHVKARHFARLQSRTAIPDLLANLAGMAGAVVTGEPGVLVAAQAANVAMQLRFTREFENEADRLAVVYATRAGYEPAAITRFFERIVAERRRLPEHQIPPYLYSHPDVEDRIAAVEIAAREARPARAPEAGSREALPEVQARLALLLERQRASLPGSAAPRAREATAPLLAEAERLHAEGRSDEALRLLARAEALDPGDPQIPFRTGEILAASGRHADAALAYRRTLALDPTRGLVFFRLGEAWSALGDRGRAVFAFEQARDRSGAQSPLRQRAEWELAKQTYEVLFATGVSESDPRGRPRVGVSRQEIPPGARRLAWWGELSPRFDAFLERISVRWRDPEGGVRAESAAERLERPYVGSVLDLEGTPASPGLWSVEALIDDDVIDRREFRVQSPPASR
jgi:predicted Zn-dependent protease